MPVIITSSENKRARSILVFIILTLLLIIGIIMPKFIASQIPSQRIMLVSNKINIEYSWVNDTSFILNITNHSSTSITLVEATYGKQITNLNITVPANSSRTITIVLRGNRTTGLLRLTFIAEGKKGYKYLWVHR